MSKIVGRELMNWCSTLKKDELDEYDITVINIIIKYYNELIEAGGIYGGKRAKKFAEYVNNKSGTCDKSIETLSFGREKSNNRIRRIKSLSVDSFRGFAVSREFDLNKQYVFLYGPNGSGKSSFSEALEYGLLDTIQEAEANKIKLSIYIRNTSTKKGKKPKVKCIFEDNSEGEAQVDFDTYRFAFVEKNRISDFSHISVLNSKNQNERIAALFGLSEFNDFVQGFTTNFDEKYLLVKSPTEEIFNNKKVNRDIKEKQKNDLKLELNEVQNLCKAKINELQKDGISDIDKALDYIQNPQTGILTLKIAERNRNHKELVSQEDMNGLRCILKEVLGGIGKLTDYRNKLTDQAIQVNYRALYEAIGNIEEGDVCPACGTPIVKTERNPFSYAKEQLKKFTELETIKSNINDCAKDIKKDMQELTDFFKSKMQVVQILHIDINDMSIPDVEEIRRMDNRIEKWKTMCEKIMKMDEEILSKEISKYNVEAEKSNGQYDMQVDSLRELDNQLVMLKTKINEKKQGISTLEKEIREFDVQSADILKQIQHEKSLCEFDQKIIASYCKVINNLISYSKELPRKIARDLEEKVIEYYNTINQDDAAFEKIKEITLPNANSDKLMITFDDGNSVEALQVLSEGHIKILGLSILLAKAIHDKLKFIIFDDIVNAIDDDHRNGVADLLMNHSDFNDVQIILSTHGDQFVIKLQDKLGKSRYNKDAVTYQFMPADSLEERGVIAKYSDAKAPLDSAEKKYQGGEYKDAASKCRTAMECLAYNLWRAIARTSNGMITVGVRGPKSEPDLKSIVEGLRKKISKIGGMEDIQKEIDFLQLDSNWWIFNKGTHYEDEQKEFEHSDIKTVIDHLNNLDSLIRNIKIVEKAVEKE